MRLFIFFLCFLFYFLRKILYKKYRTMILCKKCPNQLFLVNNYLFSMFENETPQRLLFQLKIIIVRKPIVEPQTREHIELMSKMTDQVIFFARKFTSRFCPSKFANFLHKLSQTIKCAVGTSKHKHPISTHFFMLHHVRLQKSNNFLYYVNSLTKKVLYLLLQRAKFSFDKKEEKQKIL